MTTSRCWFVKILPLGLLLVTSCHPTPAQSPQSSPFLTPTDVPPTETAVPLAAIVNDEPILLEEYQSELARYQDARGTDLATQNDGVDVVLRALIEQTLLAQAALENGVVLQEQDIESRLEQLIADMGGETAYSNWLEANHYTRDTFWQALTKELLATEMIEAILSQVPETELQAHARHILVASQEEAEGLRLEILAGADFAELAVLYSMDLSTRPGGGDLGWFPRGTLTLPAIEDLIFELESGEVSEVVTSEFGYHIVQLLALEERTLTYEALTERREEAVENWLEAQWAEAEIEILITS
jgi:hypothetical protein